MSVAGVGASVTNKALTSNVATLTTGAAHGFAANDIVLVRGVDATFDGQYTVATAPTATTFTYAKTASNVGSTAVTGMAACSKRCRQGYARFSETQDWYGDAETQTAEVQGAFSIWLINAAKDQRFDRNFNAMAELLIAVPKDVSTPMNDAWDLALNIADAIGTRTNYQTTEYYSTSVNVELQNVDALTSAGIASFVYSIAFIGD